LGIDEAADRLINAGIIPPLVIVMPREYNYLEDPQVSRYGQVVVEDLIPFVDQNYYTIPDRDHRAIGGLSRGAGWAMRLGLSEWELFSIIGAHSLAQFPGDYYLVPEWRKAIPDSELPRIYIDIGTDDFISENARGFEARLSSYRFPHEFHLNQGTHNEEYWSTHVEEYLIWYTRSWRTDSSD
jgi:enterochelin esterase-like enzyme